MSTDLAGRIALVTGGASGIGAATAKALTEAGAKVVVSDINDGAKVAAAVGAKFFRHDVTSEAEWVAAVAFARSMFGGLDILVNNAGIFLTRPTAQTSLEEFRRVMQVNVDGVFLGLKHAIPAIAERAEKWDGGGSVVNLSSVSGIVGQANTLAYNASKGAVRLMTKSSAIECARAKLKVRVNSVHPGIIDTPMVAQFAAVLSERTGLGSNSIRERFVENHPMGRLGRDIDIANAITFLASDKAAFMTGSELVVDGGWTAA
jgi:NAD(P)-dependent dehydrogenase (short-subunit alcohol dehydrogenase family)